MIYIIISLAALWVLVIWGFIWLVRKAKEQSEHLRNLLINPKDNK